MDQKINCQNCKFWSFDMDMDPFCIHPNASGFGTNINTMRGTERSEHMRGEPCGPDAKLFEQAMLIRLTPTGARYGN